MTLFGPQQQTFDEPSDEPETLVHAGVKYQKWDCPPCKGTGWRGVSSCEKCGAQGWVWRRIGFAP